MSEQEEQAQGFTLDEETLKLVQKYNLTGKIIPFLDRHLVFPLLASLENNGIYGPDVMLQMKYDLLKETDMVDYVGSLYNELHGKSPEDPLPAEFEEKKQEIERKLAELREETAPTLDVLSKEEVIDKLKQDKKYNLEFLEKEYGIDESKINKLYEYGQLEYNCGNYVTAADLLNNFRVFSTNNDLIASATWGKLAAEILTLQWDTAVEELTKLREVIDTRSFADPLTQLHHRSWVIHWALFPFFNMEGGREQLNDLFCSSSYMSTIQAACPWIISYLVAGVISTPIKNHNSQNFQKRLKDLIRVVGQETYEYSDPLTEFVKALYIDFDFEEAQAKLAESEAILRTDFFLNNVADQFLSSARYLISEVYCRVHQRIDLTQLCNSLNLSREQGEKWIASLIKDTKMIVKIDESEGTVIMNNPTTGVYQEIIEKTKGLSFKANQMLMQAVQKQQDSEAPVA